jgi:succinoglycan biosynthesis protein ExoA
MGISKEKSIFSETYYGGRPWVSIVIPCRNERDNIEAALRSIMAQKRPPGGFEVIVADGMSDDGTRDVLVRLSKEDSRLRIVDNTRQIVSTGLNAAIREAKGSIIVRMDAHTEYASDYIRQCVQTLRETAADNVGGPWIAKGEGRIGQAIAAAFQSSFASGGARGHDPNYSGPVDTVYLGCWPREIFDRIGMFDEELARNQDDEINLRLRRTGGKIWQSTKIKSWYYPRESLLSLLKQQMQYGYWKVPVIQKHKIPASARHIVPAGFVLSLILLPLASFWSHLAASSWLILAGTYSACNISASFVTAARRDWSLFPLLPIVFACYHFGYGYGFLRGICDFIVLRRGPSRVYAALTRSGNLPPKPPKASESQFSH